MKKKIARFSAAFLAVILVFNLYAQPKAQAALTEAAATTFLAELATVAANGAGLITTGATATTELTTVTAAAVTEYAAATGTTATALAGTTAGAATVGSGGTILILAAGAAIIAGIIAFIANKYNVEEINASEPMQELTTFAGFEIGEATYVQDFGGYYNITKHGGEIVKYDNGTVKVMGQEITTWDHTYGYAQTDIQWPMGNGLNWKYNMHLVAKRVNSQDYFHTLYGTLSIQNEEGTTLRTADNFGDPTQIYSIQFRTKNNQYPTTPFELVKVTNQTDSEGRPLIIPICDGSQRGVSTYSRPYDFGSFLRAIYANNAPTVTLPEVQTKTITITNNHYHNTITTTERERLVIRSTEPSTADSLEQRIQDYLQQVIRGAGAIQTIVEDIPIDWDDIPETEDAYEEDPGDQPAGDIDPGDLIGLLDGSAFASIWHYVLELLALGADGIDAIKAVFDGLPYAVKLPYYASLAVMLIFGVLLRILI